MIRPCNEHDEIDVLGPGPLSQRFVRVREKGTGKEYLVFADTMRYSLDDQPHPLDVREMVVVERWEEASEDGVVSVKMGVWG